MTHIHRRLGKSFEPQLTHVSLQMYNYKSTRAYVDNIAPPVIDINHALTYLSTFENLTSVIVYFRKMESYLLGFPHPRLSVNLRVLGI